MTAFFLVALISLVTALGTMWIFPTDEFPLVLVALSGFFCFVSAPLPVQAIFMITLIAFVDRDKLRPL